ncbi:hypothetical protein [Nostoc sp. KVJ20]|nr:hypothetical protein [Nostoc sp. KVJ20]
MPIIQSLLRHAQASGFGTETADVCRMLLVDLRLLEICDKF